jgi:hypothetical protein
MDTIKSAIVSAPAAAEKSAVETAKATRSKIRKAEAARAAESREKASRQSEDQFTASESVVGGAVYDVRDIHKGQSSLDSVQVEPIQNRLHGEKVIRKMVEMPLAVGLKRLRVYSQDK